MKVSRPGAPRQRKNPIVIARSEDEPGKVTGIMKVALIRPNEREMARYRMRETNIAGVFPPLGLAHLAAVLREAGHRVSILDAHAENIPGREVGRHIPPDAGVIGLSSTTKVWPVVVDSVRRLKETHPGALIVIGGPQVTAYPRESLRGSLADIGVIGEGEPALLEIVTRRAGGGDCGQIPQTVIRRGEEIVVFPPPAAPVDLNELPPPALDLLPLRKYQCIIARKPFLTMVTTRGCPYRCAFCSQIYHGGRIRMESAESVVARMETYVNGYGAREIIIFDDVFTFDRERVMKICSLIREQGLRVRLDIRARVDNVDPEMLQALYRAGCRRIHFGIESGTQRMLDRMRKGITIEQIEKAVAAASAAGLETRGYFILGYPGETRKETEATLDFSRKLSLNWVSYTIATINPRTELEEEARRLGLLKLDFWREYTLGKILGPPPAITSPGYSQSALSRAKVAGYLKFYSRRRIIAQTAVSIWRRRQLRQLFQGLTAGWREIKAAS